MAERPASVGPFRVEGVLGQGGGGIVYRARRESDGAPAAVKTLARFEEGALAGIRREIHALARLRHPGIVRVLAEGLDDGRPWYAMELVDGTSLRAWLSGRGLLDRLSVARRLCAPLAYAHGEGVVHRDIKPENVVIRPDGSPVLIDFGLASRFEGRHGRDELAVPGDVVGTPWYIAPEQARGEVVDARADLYALGCLLFEMATDRPPFQGRTTAEILLKHLEAEPERLSAVVPGVPARLDVLVMGLLKKEPGRRIGHADDVAEALGKLGASGPPEPGPAPRPYLYRPGMSGRDELLGRVVLEGEQLARAGGGRLTLFAGESGVGKTRLLVESVARARAAGFCVVAFECAPDRPELPGIVRDVVDRCRELGADRVGKVIAPRARTLAALDSSVAHLASDQEPHVPDELPPDAARLLEVESVAGLLRGLAGREPLCVVADDLQWADDLTVELLRYLLRSAAKPATLLLAAARAEEASALLDALRNEPGVSVVDVSRLTPEAVAEIAGDMLASDVPPGLADYLVASSEGVPLFVAEYLRVALLEGLLRRDARGRWRLADGGGAAVTLALPGSLRELLERRLLGLSPDAAAILELSAVMGRRVDESLLHEASGLPEPDAIEAFRELVHRHVLEERPAGGLRFAHDKVREVAYGRLPPARRRELHRRTAEVLARQPRPNHQALGGHWEQAGEPGAARRSYVDAAQGAFARHGHREAEDLLRRALALPGADAAEVLRMRLLLADALAAAGRSTEAASAYADALACAREAGDVRAEASSLLGLATALLATGRIDDACARIDEAIAKASALGDWRTEGDARRLLAVMATDQGRMEEARDLHRELIAYWRSHGDERAEGVALTSLGRLELELGHLDAATRLLDEAREILVRVGHRRGEGSALRALAHVAFRRGHLPEALSLCEAAAAVLQEVGDLKGTAVALSNMAVLLRELGRIDQARSVLVSLYGRMRALGDVKGQAVVLRSLGNVAADAGDPDRARELYREALHDFERLREPGWQATALGDLAGAHVAAGALPEAEAAYRQCLALLEEVSDRPNEAITCVNLGNVLRRLTRDGEAEALYRRALAIQASVGDRHNEGVAMTALGSLCADAGRVDEARALLEAALERHREADSAWYARETEERLRALGTSGT